MIELRNLNYKDVKFILENWSENILPGYYFPNSKEKVLKLINQWNRKSYNGKYFEMYIIEMNKENVGLISVQQHNFDTLSIGISIQSISQNKGIGYEAIETAIKILKEDGWINLISRCMTDNDASVALHKKCKFKLTGKSVNRKGHEVFTWNIKLN